jgi:AraC-like DNA-binding protein
MDTSLVPHAHPHCHIILKASGPDQTFTVEDRTLQVREDTAILVNAWERHHYAHRQSDQRTVFLALYIEPSWLRRADGIFASCAGPAFFPRSGVMITDDIRVLRTEMVQRIESDGYDDHREVAELIFRLTTSIVHPFADWHGASTREERGVPDFRIRRAIRTIGATMDLNRIACEAGLSRPHFNYLFRQYTGVSPGLVRNAIRVEQSVQALSSRNCSLTTLSEELGFSAQGNFTRFFRQHTGANPHQFRRVLAELG